MKLAGLAVVLALAGCASKKRAPAPAPEAPEATEVAPSAPEARPAPDRPPPPAMAEPGPARDFPPECTAYAELVDRLKTCDALGSARDGLTEPYRELRAAWPSVPAARRPTVAAQCKTQADSVRNAVAATCHW